MEPKSSRTSRTVLSTSPHPSAISDDFCGLANWRCARYASSLHFQFYVQEKFSTRSFVDLVALYSLQRLAKTLAFCIWMKGLQAQFKRDSERFLLFAVRITETLPCGVARLNRKETAEILGQVIVASSSQSSNVVGKKTAVCTGSGCGETVEDTARSHMARFGECSGGVRSGDFRWWIFPFHERIHNSCKFPYVQKEATITNSRAGSPQKLIWCE